MLRSLYSSMQMDRCLSSYYLSSCGLLFAMSLAVSGMYTMYAPSIAKAFPARSTQVEEKGFTSVESPLPWISGWNLNGQAKNVKDLLSSKAKQGFKGAYLVQCATWEPKCEEILKFINRQRGQLIEAEINVIAIFTENISGESLSKWLAERELSPHEHLSIIIDRYHRSAIRTGAFEEQKQVQAVSEANDPNTHITEQLPAKIKRLRLPLGLIVTSDGTVLSIISQAGADLLKIITQTIRYAGE